ncbi:hypothetical protein AXW67_11460 [Bradyrhizobium neotropicale]|uniref:Aldehyde oxidase/xanthine dehydrogenase a/b hammerhead domain-containing protein n=1 Tax=Bradyrhizobium neotropicale TaxID=1497615 RepID=A0A176Z7I9_9BRAD|nr:hypothetical protein AXW67_11460 [Bradyrhizobium neotropicale]
MTGGAAYVQDMRLPGMLHARVVRPPSYGAQMKDCDTSPVEKMPGVVKVVRNGNFLAAVAEGTSVGQGHGCARGRCAVAGKHEAAKAKRSARGLDNVAVAGFDNP